MEAFDSFGHNLLFYNQRECPVDSVCISNSTLEESEVSTMALFDGLKTMVNIVKAGVEAVQATGKMMKEAKKE